MKIRIISFLLVSLLSTGIGMVCGGLIASHGETEQAEDDHSHDSGSEAAPKDGASALSPQALKNIGVRAEAVELGSFTRYQPVAAVVSAAPNYFQEVFAPVAGRVKSVEARFGAMVQSGDLLVTLIRDPIPWVELTLTGDVLKPVSENLHDSMADFRRATLSVEILKKELNRLKAFSSDEDPLPLLPAKELIKLEYDLMEAERELSIVYNELFRHGLSEQEIHAIEGGEIPPIDAKIWLGALKNNGYWTSLAQDIYSALPENHRHSTWSVATIAELVAGDLVDASLIDWLGRDAVATDHFLEIGGLLQRGHNLENIKELNALGALEPTVKIRAPAKASSWDVRDLRVKTGQYVEARESLLVLEDPRSLYLQAEPTDSEIGSVVAAMRSGSFMEARPLIPGAGPFLEGLKIQKIFSDDEGHTRARLPLSNSPLFKEESEEGAYRSWQLRYGQRYELRVPLEEYEQVYVIPTGAVVDDGMDKIIFLKTGDGFQKINVEVLYQDHEVALLPASSDIFPGNPIVTRGAFPLSLALQSGGQQAAQGCGHNH
ncbi:MAG: hypothetical protein ABIK28_12800 [Planctomycetota bacterium]